MKTKLIIISLALLFNLTAPAQEDPAHNELRAVVELDSPGCDGLGEADLNA